MELQSLREKLKMNVMARIDLTRDMEDAEIGIDEVKSELLPADKVAEVEALLANKATQKYLW